MAVEAARHRRGPGPPARALSALKHRLRWSARLGAVVVLDARPGDRVGVDLLLLHMECGRRHTGVRLETRNTRGVVGQDTWERSTKRRSPHKKGVREEGGFDRSARRGAASWTSRAGSWCAAGSSSWRWRRAGSASCRLGCFKRGAAGPMACGCSGAMRTRREIQNRSRARRGQASGVCFHMCLCHF